MLVKPNLDNLDELVKHLNFNQKKAKVDNYYIDNFTVNNTKYKIDYMQFIEDIFEVLDIEYKKDIKENIKSLNNYLDDTIYEGLSCRG